VAGATTNELLAFFLAAGGRFFFFFSDVVAVDVRSDDERVAPIYTGHGGELGSKTLLPSTALNSAALTSAASTSDEQSEPSRRRIRSSASSTATAYLAPKATGGKAAGLAPATHRRTPRLLLRGGEVEVEPLRGRTEAEHAAVD
jgi:hypothetical protein